MYQEPCLSRTGRSYDFPSNYSDVDPRWNRIRLPAGDFIPVICFWKGVLPNNTHNVLHGNPVWKKGESKMRRALVMSLVIYFIACEPLSGLLAGSKNPLVGATAYA